MTSQTVDEITEAEAAVAKSEADLERVAAALLAPEPTATAVDLVAAEEEVARRRGILAKATEYKHRRLAAEAERARLARLAELDGLIRSRFGDHEASIVDLFDNAVEVVAPLLRVIADRNRALDEVAEELRSLGPLPEHLQTDGGSMRPTGGSIYLPRMDVHLEPLDLESLAAEVIWRAGQAAGVAVPQLEGIAGIARDRMLNLHLGITDGSMSQAPAPSGPSDRIRRTARIVSER